MSILINEETKQVTKKSYDRCCLIEINSPKIGADTVTTTYETILEIDGEIQSHTISNKFCYDCAYIAPITKEINGKEISIYDVMCFIEWFTDNYQEALAQVEPVVVVETPTETSGTN